MNIRTKVSLWISVASIVPTIVFSLFVFSEFLENVYEQIDQDLSEVAYSISYHYLTTKTQPTAPDLNKFKTPHPFQHYALTVYNSSGEEIYANKLGQAAGIPLSHTSDGYFSTAPIPINILSTVDRNSTNSQKRTTRFRLKEYTPSAGDKSYIIQIGKPIAELSSEITEVLWDLAMGIAITLCIIAGISYFIAGRVLKPLVTTNSFIRKIRESSLNERIPLGKNHDELYALSSSLNSMFDRLEHSFTRQREFIGNASHELKSPLTILMLGHERMIISDPPVPIRDELESQLYTMQRLNKLVRDMLSIARLEQNETLNRTKFKLEEIIATVVDDYTEALSAKNIVLTSDSLPITVSGDEEKILRVFINLIDNAIKYNHNNFGWLRISNKLIGQAIQVTVSNSCMEMSEEDLPKIFDQFYRIEKSHASIYGGSGLGLTIVKRIIELHGGEISVKSTNDSISFSFLLPLSK